jgi:ribose transport system substrate-binding protein
MGDYTIEKDPTRDGAMRIVMGPFSKYTKDNIDKELGAAPAPAAPAASGSKEAPDKTGNLYIPIISKGFQHQFWQAVKAGSEKAAKDLNVKTTFEGPETEAMVDKQMEMLQTAIDKKPAAICFAAVDSKAAIPLLQKAQAAKIPVIGFDSGVDSDIPVTTAATDNVAAAALAADKMAELIGKKGTVAVIAHDQTSRTGIDRVKGFLDEMKAKYPDIKVLTPQYGAGDQLKSTDIAKAVISANPDIKGYFGANEGSIIGVLNAVKELKMEGKLVVIGYDSGQQQLDAIRAGTEAGAITQDPIGIGYKCVESALKAIRGETLPKVIDTGFHWYDKTNIDDPAIAALLYK